MGDTQRLARINHKITLLSGYIEALKVDRQELTSRMGPLIGDEFLEAFEELGKIDAEIELVKREKIRLETLRGHIE